MKKKQPNDFYEICVHTFSILSILNVKYLYMLLYISYFGTQKLNSLENVAFVLISFFIYDFDNVCTHNIAYIAS